MPSLSGSRGEAAAAAPSEHALQPGPPEKSSPPCVPERDSRRTPPAQLHVSSPAGGAPSAETDVPASCRTTPLLQLASYLAAVESFAAPLGAPAAAVPRNVETIVQRVLVWDRNVRGALKRLQSPPIFRQVYDFGSVVVDTHRLLGAINKKCLDDWLNSPATDAKTRQTLDDWRRAFFARYGAIRALAAEILIASNLELFERDPLALFVRNIRKLAEVFAGKRYVLRNLGVVLGIAALALRESRLLCRLAGNQIAEIGLSFERFGDSQLVNRINALAGETLITRRHARQLHRTCRLLRQHGVRCREADAIIVAALRQAERAASKPWKGLLKLKQLVVHAGVDPRTPDFLEIFQAATDAPVQYTYTPGLEWVVRDYELGKKLLQMDGRIPEGVATAALQQGRVSVLPGIAQATPQSTEFARRYFGPVENFLNSMVTADGSDHQRLRKPFMRHFSRRAVFDLAEMVQEAVTMLLDNASAVARKNGGAFDFKRDFAFPFPIRIICGIVGIQGRDIEEVQRWTEESTRSMDTEAGVSLVTARRGQLSVKEQRAFFRKLLDDARAGRHSSELIKALACDTTLSEDERISNLSVIVFAGFETTTGLLCTGLRELLKHSEQWAFLRSKLVLAPEITVDGQTLSDVDLRWYRWAESEPREADPARRQRIADQLRQSNPLRQRLEAIHEQELHLDRAIEEMLRWCAPGSIIPLTASRELEVPVPTAMLVRGQQLGPGDPLRIARGETVIVAVDEINRRFPLQPSQFDPEGIGLFDISRTDNARHLSFGVKHMCIGATLARENAKRALEGVLRRFPDLESNGIAVPQDMELFHGLASLPVRSPSLAQ